MRQLRKHVRKLGRHAAELARRGRHLEAVAVWEALSRECPNDAVVAVGLGAALLAARRGEQAVRSLAAACAQHPGDPALLRLQAMALVATKQGPAAIGALLLALELDPADADTHAELANVLFQERLAGAALSHAALAFQVRPTSDRGSILAGILSDLGRDEEALAIIDAVTAEEPGSPGVLMLRSIVLAGLGRRAEALDAARSAVRLGPESALARHNLAAFLLGEGELTPEAWGLYESRSGLEGQTSWPCEERRWRGEDVSGRTVLLHAEQGFGDTLQFVRYAPLVAARGARVILAVQPPLVRLLQGTPGAACVVAAGKGLPAFDLYCPLLSLPGIFGTTLKTIPPAAPYAERFEPAGTGENLEVGLVWSGNPGYPLDHRRSVPANDLAALAEVSGVVWQSLQFGAESLPIPGMGDLMQGVRDFADTAERIARLDLVIAADTGVAHLAATMGKPVWLLSRHQGCWRWLQDRADTPWYPSMQLYRQRRPNDWRDVIGRVREDLECLVRAGEKVRPLAA